MKKYGFGVDIGGTTIKMGFFETSGKLIDKWEIKTNTANGGSDILSDGAKAIFKTNKIELKDEDGNVTGFEDNTAATGNGVFLKNADSYVNIAGEFAGLNIQFTAHKRPRTAAAARCPAPQKC